MVQGYNILLVASVPEVHLSSKSEKKTFTEQRAIRVPEGGTYSQILQIAGLKINDSGVCYGATTGFGVMLWRQYTESVGSYSYQKTLEPRNNRWKLWCLPKQTFGYSQPSSSALAGVVKPRLATLESSTMTDLSVERKVFAVISYLGVTPQLMQVVFANSEREAARRAFRDDGSVNLTSGPDYTIGFTSPFTDINLAALIPTEVVIVNCETTFPCLSGDFTERVKELLMKFPGEVRRKRLLTSSSGLVEMVRTDTDPSVESGVETMATGKSENSEMPVDPFAPNVAEDLMDGALRAGARGAVEVAINTVTSNLKGVAPGPVVDGVKWALTSEIGKGVVSLGMGYLMPTAVAFFDVGGKDPEASKVRRYAKVVGQHLRRDGWASGVMAVAKEVALPLYNAMKQQLTMLPDDLVNAQLDRIEKLQAGNVKVTTAQAEEVVVKKS